MDFSHVTSLTIPEGSVKAIYCNDVKLWGVSGTYENTITGTPPLTLANCTGDDLVNWSIVGNTIQDGTPSPENPVAVNGVGDWDETEQKYKIPVKSNDTVTNIYLDSPLMTGETITSEGERDVEWKKLVLTGAEYFSKLGSTFYFSPTDFERDIQTVLYSTHFKFANASYKYTNVGEFSIKSGSGSSIWFGSIIETADDFKQWLSDQYNAGTPVTVYYQLATPTTETFTPPSIPTNQGTTVLDTDCVVAPSEMTVTFMSTTPQNEETR